MRKCENTKIWCHSVTYVLPSTSFCFMTSSASFFALFFLVNSFPLAPFRPEWQLESLFNKKAREPHSNVKQKCELSVLVWWVYSRCAWMGLLPLWFGGSSPSSDDICPMLESWQQCETTLGASSSDLVGLLPLWFGGFTPVGRSRPSFDDVCPFGRLLFVNAHLDNFFVAL